MPWAENTDHVKCHYIKYFLDLYSLVYTVYFISFVLVQNCLAHKFEASKKLTRIEIFYNLKILFLCHLLLD